MLIEWLILVPFALLVAGLTWRGTLTDRPITLPDDWFTQEHGLVCDDLHRDTSEDVRVAQRRWWQ